jgi:hypothetical protein
MRKFWLFITTLVTLGFLAGASWAGQVSISGTHSPDEIKGTCSEVGGTFSEGANRYTCDKDCGNDICIVTCQKTTQKCTGTCPKCGQRILPVFGGSDAADRILKNSGARPSK